ncbi:non-ribosomal peptide synthetase [Streptomyces cheonanensis]|uniref:Phenyloxazoline synthase MbtB n=1 Tax=Streptomyces cheonanensis TaxID=312720 RepID=A0ABN2VBP4_9ACTN
MTEATEPGRAAVNRPDILAAVAALLEIPPHDIGPDDDVFALGLDSLGLIRLTAQWRRQGLGVGYEELAESPTVRDWERLLAAADGTTGAPPAADPADGAAPEEAAADAGDGAFPLGLMQHAYWIGRQDDQPLGGVAAHFYAELDGHGVEPGRLATAVTALRLRHEMLRITVLDDGRQRISDAPSHPAITVHDLTATPPEDISPALDRIRDSSTHRRMDVERGEVFDVALSLLPGGATRLHIDLDMIAADAASMRVLLADLQHLYTAPDTPLPELPTGYRAYLERTGAERTEDREQARAWWQERLHTLSAPPALPTVVDPLSPESSAPHHHRTTRLHHRLDPERTARLLERSKQHGLTPTAVLATAFAEVLAAWSAEPRFLLNLPLFHRDTATPGVERLVGDFSSSILLDVDLTEDRPFTEHAGAIRAGLRAAIARGAYSGVEVLRDLTRAAGGTPRLAPVVYTSALGLGEVYDRPVRETFGEPVWIISQGPQVWLDAQVTELDGGLLLNWDVRENLFEPGTVTAAFTAYRRLIDSLVDDEATWSRPVGPQLPAAQLLVRERVNGTDPAAGPARLHEGFHRTAAADPERVALIDERGRPVGYGELARWAGRVTALLRSEGVRPGDTVVVSLPRGAAQVAAVLGTLGAGAAYVPVGTGQPAERAALVTGAAGAAAVLTDTPHSAPWRERLAGTTPVLSLDAADDLGPVPPALDQPADSLAYLIFTSGSTGVPKGVEVSHRAAMNTLAAINERFGVGPADRGLALAELDFDMSVYDLFGPLSAGGSVVLIDQSAQRDAQRWAELVREHGVTLVNCVPALLDMLLTAAETGRDPGTSLRLVLLGGDWVGLDLPPRLRALVPEARFVALGGMTEAAVHSTVFEVGDIPEHWTSVPWGVPLPGMRTRVVDSRGRDCPDWVPGELWVAGTGLADGYRGDPARTAERFVQHDGHRWYRTGDRARYRDDGVLEFLGRTDHQVKINGHRIELGEVEATAAGHPGVHAAVAVVTGEPRGLGLVVAGATTAEEVGATLRAALPAYMVPGRVTVVDALPLTRNGKPDRERAAALLAERPGDAAPAGNGGPPTGWAETVVAQVWSELLGADGIGRHDSFFALGGDSLLATRMIALLRRRGAGGAGVARLFSHPRLAEFAEAVTRTVAREDVLTEGDPAHRHDPFPPTDVQRAFWIGRDDRLPLGGVGTYHYSEFDGADVDLDRLRRAWRRLVRRHEMLRAVFDDQGRQRILPEVPEPAIEVTEVEHESEADAALAALRQESSHRRLDLTRWPLFDVRAVRYPHRGQTRTRLAIGLDYIVLDGASIIALYGELDTLYQDPEAPLPPIDVSFRDYVLEVVPDADAVERARAYWLKRLDTLPPAPALPLAGDPSALARPHFTRRSRPLAADRWERLRRKAARHQLTPSAVLLLCYVEVLAAWSEQDGVTVNLTLFNRLPVHPHIHRLIGDFTSVSLIGHRPLPDEEWPAAAQRLQGVMGEDLDHREESAIWLMQELARRTGTVDAAMPVVFSSSVGVGDREVKDLSDTFPAKVFGISQTPQVMLDNQVTESRGGILISWDGIEELFLPGVLDAMFDTYCALVDRLVEEEWAGPLPLAPPAEQVRRRREAGNGGAGRPPAAGSLHGAFFDRAAADPGRTAVRCAEGDLTYGALAGRAERVAAALAERGVGPGDTVALTLPSRADQITAALGVLRAGAAFAAVDPGLPEAEREARYQAAEAATVITAAGPADPTASAEAETGSGPGSPVRVPLPLLLASAAPCPPGSGDATAAAYCRFRTGPGGAPRGVLTSHAAARAALAGLGERVAVTGADRVLALGPLGTDRSVFDLFGVLGSGGSLVLPNGAEQEDPAAWAALVVRHEVTVSDTTPLQLDQLLDALPAGDGRRPAHRLRLAVVSAGRVPPDLPGRLREAAGDGCALVALGGATGAPLWASVLTANQDPRTPLAFPRGTPLPGHALRVVDSRGRDCPEWVVGELWIGGDALPLRETGAGDPSAPSGDGTGRWYRTGERARFRPDATVEFLGPAGQAVTLAGRRVEPGEVETALEAHPGIGHAVVLALGEDTHRRLHAVVTARGAEPTDLARQLSTLLPAHATPTGYTFLDRLPLTPDGTADRERLASLAAATAGRAGPPATPTERRVAAIWERVLGTEVTDRHAGFFAEGGDSITALRLVAAVNSELGADVPVRTFLAAATLADLAVQAESSATTHLPEESGII